jgi:hypothetical protein
MFKIKIVLYNAIVFTRECAFADRAQEIYDSIIVDGVVIIRKSLSREDTVTIAES